MALPSSGPLSFQDIATELGVNPPLSLAAMSTTAGFTAPFEVTDFYGYSGGGVITNGLVFYVDASNPASYSGTGTTWFDLSPNGYNATLSGNATYNSGNGGYISLQSNTGFINFGSVSAGSNTSSYTWGAWVKFTDVSSTNIFMARGNDSSSGWNLAAVMLTTGFNASMVTTVPSTSQINSVYSTTPVANTWYYYTAVFDAGVSLKVYINGVLRATQNSSSTNLRNSGEGWSSTLGTTYYNADYGSMIAYNTALTDAEVLQNYDATKERFGIVTSGLVLNLDASNPSSYSGTGDTWTDLSTSGNNATLVNSPTFSSNNGGYLTTNGTSSYITIPNNATLNSNVTTISVWFQYTTVTADGGSGYGGLISKADPSGTFNGWNIYIFNNIINAQIKATGSSVTDLAGTTINTATWYNITLVSVSGGTSFLYLNNVLLSSVSTVSYTVTSQPLRFARAVDSFWSYFGGNVGQIMQYDRALNTTELTENYNATKTRFGL